MSNLEQRIRAATRATADEIPLGPAAPLRLPADGGCQAARARPRAGGRRAGGWLAPVTAAVGVAALIIGCFAIVRAAAAHDTAHHAVGHPAGHGRPAAAPLAAPPYYASVVYAPSTAFDGDYWGRHAAFGRDVVIRSSVTGQVLATTEPPAGELLTQVRAGAGEDNFIVMAQIASKTAWAQARGLSLGLTALAVPARFYLLSFDPASHATRLTALPVPALTGVEDFTLSPDGGTLAVSQATPIHPARSEPATVAVRTFSLASGASRTWEATTTNQYPDWPATITGMSWTTSQTLAYSLNSTRTGLLDTSAAGDSLTGDSALFPAHACPVSGVQVFVNPPAGLLAVYGSRLICAPSGNTATGRPYQVVVRPYTVTGGRIRVTTPGLTVPVGAVEVLNCLDPSTRLSPLPGAVQAAAGQALGAPNQVDGLPGSEVLPLGHNVIMFSFNGMISPGAVAW